MKFNLRFLGAETPVQRVQLHFHEGDIDTQKIACMRHTCWNTCRARTTLGRSQVNVEQTTMSASQGY